MIMFVDDEAWRNEAYVLELKYAGYQVEYVREADAAWQCFEQNQEDIQAVVLDILMAPGKRYGDRTEAYGGLRTGVLLFRDMRANRPDLPAVFLTNLRYDQMAEDLASERNVLFLRKLDYLPSALPERLDALLKGALEAPASAERGE